MLCVQILCYVCVFKHHVTCLKNWLRMCFWTSCYVFKYFVTYVLLNIVLCVQILVYVCVFEHLVMCSNILLRMCFWTSCYVFKQCVTYLFLNIMLRVQIMCYVCVFEHHVTCSNNLLDTRIVERRWKSLKIVRPEACTYTLTHMTSAVVVKCILICDPQQFRLELRHPTRESRAQSFVVVVAFA